MDFEEVVLKRRSVRKFKDIPISEEVIDKMLLMAQAAPSAGNGQNHLFGIIRDGKTKHDLAKAAGNQMWIAGAPVVIACCARMDEDFNQLPEDDFGLQVDRLRWGKSFLEYLTNYPNWNDVAAVFANATPLIPAEHMLLTAVSYGVSGCFVGWLDIAKASRILNLPPDIRCLFLLPVGYSDETPGDKEIKTIAEISFYDSFVNKL